MYTSESTTIQEPTNLAVVGGLAASDRIHERRRSYRIIVNGDAVLYELEGRSHRYHLTDLSLGGAKLAGPHALPPSTKLQVVIDTRGVHFSASAVVVRCADEGGYAVVSVRFCDTSPDMQDNIHHLVLSSLEHHYPAQASP